MAVSSKTNFITIAGLFLVIAMMTIAAGVALSGFSTLRTQIDEVATTNSQKLKHISTMRHSHRLHLSSLQSMLLLVEEYEFDALSKKILAHSNSFISTEKNLLETSKDGPERATLERISELNKIKLIIASDLELLIRERRLDTANDLLLKKLHPIQEELSNTYTTLEHIYTEEVVAANQSAQTRAKAINNRIILLLGIVTLLCMAIIAHVTRRINRSEVAMIKHTDTLEKEVEERAAELEKEAVERERAEQLARQESKRLAVTLASIGDGVVTLTHFNTIDYMNPEAERLTQFSKDEAVGCPVARVLHMVDYDTGERLDILNEASSEVSSEDVMLRCPDDSQIDIHCTYAPITDDQGRTYGSVVVLRDVSEAKALSRKLAHEATHDSLTGLVNRREFERKVKNALDDAAHNKKAQSLCYIDLDKFKTVNDTAGHGAGDKLLIEISDRIKNKIGENDTLARLGGDEFGLLLEDRDLDQASEVAELLLTTVKEYRLIYDGQVFGVGASIGVIEIGQDTSDLESLLCMADAACYMSKEKGRNCVSIFRPTDAAIVLHRDEASWSGKIRNALANREFDLHCQAIVGISATNKNHCHYEILIRMKNEDSTVVFPGAFLPAAERFGLMPAIDRFVIEETFAWLADNSYLLGASRLSVNISGDSLSEPGFLQFVEDTLQNTGANLDQIIFEVTESVVISNIETAISFMNTLSTQGCKFALDDFGKGFSSLTNLKELPLDYLKIDGNFVKDLLNNSTDEATVRAINELGHALGMVTVAEFVESIEICDRLEELGVDYAQGFALSRPAPLNEMINESTLAKRAA